MLACLDEVEDRSVTVPPDFRRVIVHVLCIPERRCRVPFLRTEPQTGRRVRRGEIGFAERGKPHREQVSVRALGDRGAVILADEHGADGARRNTHKQLRSLEERRVAGGRRRLEHGLTYALRILRRRRYRQRLSFRQIALDDAKPDALAGRVLRPRAAIRRAQETDHRGMMTAAKHAAVAVHAPDRIGLRGALKGPVPVEAPLGDIAMHVVQAPGIRSLLCDAQRTRAAGSRFLRRMIQTEDLTLLQRRRGGLARGAPVILARHWAGRKVDPAIVILAEPLLVSIRQRVAGVEERRRARAASILPLSLGR